MLLNLKTFVRSINSSWLNFKLQTQLILATITLILVLSSSILSWSINVVQDVPNTNNVRFLNDINSLLKENILSLIEEKRSTEIVTFCERFYRTSTSLRYIVFIDQNGIYYGITYNFKEIFPNATASNSLNLFESFRLHSPMSSNFDGTDLQVTVLSNETFLGLLLVGSKSSSTLLSNYLITNEIIFSLAIISLSAVLLGGFFVKATITRPLIEVANGLVNIAAGNFSKRIDLRFGGELGDLINSFNELGRRLQLYEEKNRVQLFSEKVKLESLITTINDGAILLDTNLRIVLVNTTAIRIFGWKTKTRLLGTPIWDHLPIVLQKKLFVTLQNILCDSQSAIFDTCIENEALHRSMQSIRVILNVIYEVSERNKIPLGIGIIVQDKTKEFELWNTQNRFMGNISHELRTPLFNIKSFIETIQEYDYTLSNWQKRYFLDIVNKETNRLTRLVNDILCLSKLDTLKDVPLETMNVSETINQTVANYQIISSAKKLYLHSELAHINLTVPGNKDLLLQVLVNIVGNALKFTYELGEIILRAYPMANKRIRIEIIDTGVGIIYANQQYIFQRFYRIENEVHTLQGTGLGLSIVGTILFEHKTEIHLVSRYRVGSSFWFDLRWLE